MISIILGIYTRMICYYDKKWKDDRIEQKYCDWERGLEMKKNLGYGEENFRKIPKRKIKNKAARKKHGY